MRSNIRSTGSYVPGNIIKNSDLRQFSSGVIPLIEKKTGVKERRFADDNHCTSDLAIFAARQCLKKVNYDPLDLDAIILATSSPDRIQPATATRVQAHLGALNAFAFDINSVCSGALYAIHLADALIRSGQGRNILVIAAEIYSRYLNPTDFSTYPYFGDGAGAVLITLEEKIDKGVIETILKTDGSKAEVIQVPAGGTMLPCARLENPKDVYFKMVGREVYDFAVNRGTEVIEDIKKRLGICLEDIDFVITHQANINIIKEISIRTNIPLEKFFINLDRYGNTAAASVFIALDELLISGLAHSGHLILLVAFGGGLSWGASLIRI